MFTPLATFAWAVSCALLWLSSYAPAFAQTAEFSALTDALPGRCYNVATTQPDAANGNRLLIGVHAGISPQTFQNAACIALDDGPALTMDTISFLVSAPPGYYITKINFTQVGSTSGSRGGAGFRGASWVVDDDASVIPATPTGWDATADLSGQKKTAVPVAITTFLAAGGGSVRSGSASATTPVVTVELAPLADTPPPPPPANPVPATTMVVPNTATAGSAALILTITCSDFIKDSVVRWGDADRPTTFISSTEVTAAIASADLTSAGEIKVTVFNPGPGGGVSNEQTFTIKAAPVPANPVPTTVAITPNTGKAGGSDFVLKVTGSDFVKNSVVRWNGADRSTTFTSSTEVTAAITAADIAAAAEAKVTVFNPSPEGGISNEQTFTILSIPPPSDTLPIPANDNVNDLRGKEWRQLTQTRGITYSQAATICPQDGATPCAGKIGPVDFTGWVWANSWQVTELLSYFAPDIVNNPSLSGSGYVPGAEKFHNLFSLTQHLTGTVNEQYINFRVVGGITATASPDAHGVAVPVGGSVSLSEDLFGTTASFNVGPLNARDAIARGIFLWRPTGLSSGSVHANNDEGQSLSPFGGTVLSVLKNDWVTGAQATTAIATVTPSASSPTTEKILIGDDGSVQVDAGALVGTYTLPYTLCAASNPALCDVAQVLVTVRSFGLLAVNDQTSPAYGTNSIPIANVLANDTIGGTQATLEVVSLRQVSTSHSGVKLNSASGAVSVAASTPSGTHTLIYEMCELAKPSNCTQATATLMAKAIEAVDDIFPKLSAKEGGESPSVLLNDRFNGGAATPANVELSLLTKLPAGITFDLDTGIFRVAPKSRSGDYSVTYQICEISSPTNCSSGASVLELSGGGGGSGKGN